LNSDHKNGQNMRKTQLDLMVPIPVRRALHKLGQDIRDARLRRRISTAVMAERASISRTTLNKIEKGDLGVSLGNYANVLFVLGMAERLGDLADVRTDAVGLELIDARLPQRIRKPRAPKSERKSGGKSSQSGQKSKA
jgi:transcriptional regulator with XRE-family HTH domain